MLLTFSVFLPIPVILSETPQFCLQLVSKIPRHDFHASESHPTEEILDVVLVARDQSAKHLQPREQALDGPASPIAA